MLLRTEHLLTFTPFYKVSA